MSSKPVSTGGGSGRGGSSSGSCTTSSSTLLFGLHKSIKKDNNSLLDCHISNEHFHKAIKSLKYEKQDGVFNKLASEHFINATQLYYEHLRSLFINCLKHGYMPNAMILSTLLPIAKDNNDLQNSHKY